MQESRFDFAQRDIFLTSNQFLEMPESDSKEWIPAGVYPAASGTGMTLL
ncbi:MAG: hypothetical protein KGJ59_14000 [Bacteroidota bacterium]|nr:hypothetical protein [Bacteroidota bacterium]